jgi:hypothetical protein
MGCDTGKMDPARSQFNEEELCWLLGSSARVYAVKEDYHAVFALIISREQHG